VCDVLCAECRGILLRPASAFRELSRAGSGRAALLRKPVLLAFVLGCTVSALASGRFSARLVLDGAVSFAFVPALELLALAVVCRTGTRAHLPLPRVVDLFFAGNAPWLLWLVVVAGVALVPPTRLGPLVDLLLLAALVPAAWSIYIDFHFFREVAKRSAMGAVADIVVHRAIAWTGAAVYFLGIVAWSVADSSLARWMGR